MISFLRFLSTWPLYVEINNRPIENMCLIRSILIAVNQVVRRNNNLHQLRRGNLLTRQQRTKKPSNQSAGMSRQDRIFLIDPIDRMDRQKTVVAAATAAV